MKRYEIIATDIIQSIETGMLGAGDRLPSVRHNSEARGVSASTVFQAYYLLEAQGYIRPRPRSGYYVCERHPRILPEAETPSFPRGDSTPVDVSELVFAVLESTMSRDVVPFGSAFPSPLLYPSARLARAMVTSMQHYDPWAAVDDLSQGNLALRRQIALRYLMHGVHVQTDEIVITNGALEALNLCLAAVTRPGDSVIVEAPTFYAALQALERNGLHAIEVPTHPRSGVDLQALALALERHRPKACWLMTNFQNPLGCSMSDDKKAALVALLEQHDVPLIEDDVYGELYFGAQRPRPAKAFDTQGLVMHCSSFSKCLAPGFRVGWAAPGRYAQAVARQKLTTTLATSSPAQAAITTYLEKGGFDRHLRELRKTLQSQQMAFTRAIAEHFPAGTRATRPAGGYFLWVEFPDNIDALNIHRSALSLGIAVAPGPIFSATRGFANCLRLNYGHTWGPRVEEALRTLGQIAKAAIKRR